MLAATMTVATIIAFLGGSLPAAAQAPSLFGDASAADAPGDHANFAARTRYVNVNLGLLFDQNGRARDPKSLPEVTLNLFPDASYTGEIKKLEHTALNSTSWIGTLSDVQGGYFYLIAADGAFIAHVASAQGVYEVSLAHNGLYRVVQVDQSRMIDDAPTNYAAPGPVMSTADLSPNADSASRIDVMVVYTPAALAAEGSLSAMKARIALAMTETNQGYLNAGVTTRLRLVHIEKVNYAETGYLGTDLWHLANPSDGVMDNVMAIRNTYAADMVSLVVGSGDACGLADAIMATAATAFDVVVTGNNCMTGYYSFGHEFGHLQGARHDWYVDKSISPFKYGHGYVHTGSTSATRWRTVMAYDKKCNDLGYLCTRLQYWSNPNKTYGGAPMGDTTYARNYAVLNKTALTVANFRTQKIANDFNSTFNSDHSGWTPVHGTWTLASSAYYTTVGVANTWSSIGHSGIYGDVTYLAKMKRLGSNAGMANALIIRGNHSTLTVDKDWKGGYWFQYNNNGLFSVWKGVNGSFTALKDWTASSKIAKGGWNTLKVVAAGSSLKFYINGGLVWSGSDSALRTGNVGIDMFRNGTSTGNKLFVDSATLATTATADINPFADVVPGVEIQGGTRTEAP